MKKILYSILAVALMALAGVQTTWAQAGMIVWQNGKHAGYRVEDVDSVQFVDNAGRFISSDYVDLGLPSGTLWATCNIGAGSPGEIGDYFAWGETEPKANYTWGTYRFCNGTETSMTKYCTDGAYGTSDRNTRLQPSDDAATYCWGEEWVMPTAEQMSELINKSYTTMTWESLGGTEGYRITSRQNGKSIFLPAAGYRYQQGRYTAYTYYWSSSLQESKPNRGRVLYFYSTSTSAYNYMSDYNRYIGMNIRPVRFQGINGHEYVDLGLPSGTKWATCNVGASSPEDYGDYFAWGETEAKGTYNWSTYKFCKGSYNTITKYCTESSYGYNGFTDGKTELEAADDAATVNWGGSWRMPTFTQIEELFNNCTREWTTLNGVNGSLLTGPNGNTIFLPAAGYRWNDDLCDAGSLGNYWSSSLSPYDGDIAYYLYFNSGYWDWDINYRNYGFSVRPVCP